MDENCHVEPLQKVATADEHKATTLKILSIQGMGCPNCAARVRNSLLSLYGVIDADVDHTMGIAKVIFNPALVNVLALIRSVARAGGDGRHEYRAQVFDRRNEDERNKP